MVTDHSNRRTIQYCTVGANIYWRYRERTRYRLYHRHGNREPGYAGSVGLPDATFGGQPIAKNRFRRIYGTSRTGSRHPPPAGIQQSDTRGKYQIFQRCGAIHAVGLILLAFLCKRAETVSDWREVLRRTAPIALITTVIVIVTAVASGFVRPEFKLSSFTPTFLATNLLFTCVAEETFFRGFLQDRLAPSLGRIRFGGPIAIFCSGILFGLTHVGGGMNYTLLATLVGIGSAYAYSATQRIEAPIMTHFTLNAVHFIGFTYPHLQ